MNPEQIVLNKDTIIGELYVASRVLREERDAISRMVIDLRAELDALRAARDGEPIVERKPHGSRSS